MVNCSIETPITEDAILTWHQKLGHIGMESLKKLAPMLDLPENMNFTAIKQCSNCAFGKTKEKKRNKALKKYGKPGDLIQADGLGSTSTTIGGNTSFQIIVNNMTSFIRVNLCKSKQDYTKHITNFIENIEKGSISIKQLQTYGTAEYKAKPFTDYLLSKGITQCYSAPYAQHQNRLAERIMGIINNLA